MAKLYFYYAAMNAGKSTTLIQADFNYRERGMETMLWTAAFDDRSGAGTIGSRVALSAPAHTYEVETDLFTAAPIGSLPQQWHGNFYSVDLLGAAEFIALLNVGCTATTASASKTGWLPCAASSVASRTRA